MADSERYTLTGSDRELPEGHTRLADMDPDEIASVTVYVRPRAGSQAPDEAGADPHPGGVRRSLRRLGGGLRRGTPVCRGARSLGRSGRSRPAQHRRVRPLGRPGRGFRGGPGDIRKSLRGAIPDAPRPPDPAGKPARGGNRGVRARPAGPSAERNFRVGTAVSVQYTPVQIAEQYDFPPGVNGTGECIGLVELGGGYDTTDLDEYFSALGLPAPTVVTVSVDGGTNSPGTDSGSDIEVMLDIEMAAAIASRSHHRGVLRAQYRPGFPRRGVHCGPRRHQPSVRCFH